MREILSRLVACGWNKSVGDCFGRGYANVGDEDKREEKKKTRGWKNRRNWRNGRKKRRGNKILKER